MDEFVNVLKGIHYELQEMNNNLEELKGNGLYCSISDINEKLDEIKGEGLYNSISDINEKLDSISVTVDNIDLNTF